MVFKQTTTKKHLPIPTSWSSSYLALKAKLMELFHVQLEFTENITKTDALKK
jgi:hypothetical protein